MSKFTTNILTTVLILTALAISAIAMWSETLKTNVLIHSGSVDIDVVSYSVIEGNEFGKPWVASCSISIVDNDEQDTVVISIVIDNGYPGYNCTTYFTIRNSGTIPVIGPFYSEVEVPEGLRLVYSPDHIWQLHPGDNLEHMVSIEVLQKASENTTYNITIEVGYVQWNEVPAEAKSVTISGYVFNDLDEDGEWDPNEPPLENARMDLLEDDNIIASTYTNENGYYSFIVYPGGSKTYTIKAYTLPGYRFTTPNIIILTVYPGVIYPNNNFGMRELPAVVALSVTKDFRETNVNFEICPAKLGTQLKKQDDYYIVYAEVPDKGPYKDKVRSISPGAFYGVIVIEGQGITYLNISDRFDYQFDVEDDGIDGRVRAYILNKVSMCVTELKRFTYTVNNMNNVVTVNITLGRPLTANEVILMYLKFKPAPGLVGSSWNSLDKYFENDVEVYTNIGSATARAVIQIVKK